MDDSTPWAEKALDFIEAGSEFPPPGTANDDGLVAIGGDLSVARLLDAYRNGIFPWFEAGGAHLLGVPPPPPLTGNAPPPRRHHPRAVSSQKAPSAAIHN